MITTEALRQLYSTTDDNEDRSMLLQWTGDQRVSLPEDLPRRERLRALEVHFAAVKEPLLEALRAEGVKVRDLPASPQAIVQATPAQWRNLLENNHLRSDPKVEILPNVMFSSLG